MHIKGGKKTWLFNFPYNIVENEITMNTEAG